MRLFSKGLSCEREAATQLLSLYIKRTLLYHSEVRSVLFTSLRKLFSVYSIPWQMYTVHTCTLYIETIVQKQATQIKEPPHQLESDICMWHTYNNFTSGLLSLKAALAYRNILIAYTRVSSYR